MCRYMCGARIMSDGLVTTGEACCFGTSMQFSAYLGSGAGDASQQQGVIP
jgi:hypothetical protein